MWASVELRAFESARCASQNLVWSNARANTKEKPKLIEGLSTDNA
jgi:hypothetical protein